MNQNKIKIHKSSKIYGDSAIGNGGIILENVIIGYPEHTILMEIMGQNKNLDDCNFPGCTVGLNSVIRPGSTLFSNVKIGNYFMSGHNVLIREKTMIGDNVMVGSNVIIDGNVTIGNNVSIQSNVYIPTNVVIEDNVFIGPCAVLTNDKYPIRKESDLCGPILRKGVSIGANATILPCVEIGEGAMVAGGALVTRDVPPWKLAIGFPAKIKELPDDLKRLNSI